MDWTVSNKESEDECVQHLSLCVLLISFRNEGEEKMSQKNEDWNGRDSEDRYIHWTLIVLKSHDGHSCSCQHVCTSPACPLSYRNKWAFIFFLKEQPLLASQSPLSAARGCNGSHLTFIWSKKASKVKMVCEWIVKSKTVPGNSEFLACECACQFVTSCCFVMVLSLLPHSAVGNVPSVGNKAINHIRRLPQTCYAALAARYLTLSRDGTTGAAHWSGMGNVPAWVHMCNILFETYKTYSTSWWYRLFYIVLSCKREELQLLNLQMWAEK